MVPRYWWMATLVFAGVGLVMGGAHVLELPVRMQYDAALYMRVTRTLYRYFGMVGGPVQVAALLLSVVLAWRLRGRVSFRSTALGAMFLALSLVLWLLIVQPVNDAWAEALSANGAEALRAYEELRRRWEAGHVAAFAAWLAGFVLLVRAVVQEADYRWS